MEWNVKSLLIQNMKLLIKNSQICDGQHCQLLENVALLDIQMTRNKWDNSIFWLNEKGDSCSYGDDLNHIELAVH